MVWNHLTGAQRTVLSRHSGAVVALAFPTEQRIISASRGCEIALHNSMSGERLWLGRSQSEIMHLTPFEVPFVVGWHKIGGISVYGMDKPDSLVLLPYESGRLSDDGPVAWNSIRAHGEIVTCGGQSATMWRLSAILSVVFPSLSASMRVPGVSARAVFESRTHNGVVDDGNGVADDGHDGNEIDRLGPIH